MAEDLAVETIGLTRQFGRNKAVDSLNLRVERGTVVGLLGRNGAGKTTTIKMLLGLLRPSRGSASVLGCDCAELTPQVLSRIGYLPEGHPMFGWMKLTDAARFFASFYRVWKRDTFEQIVGYFGLPRDQRMRRLSRGERAQVALALTVAQDPELLILDDPTQGIDAVARREFLAALVALIRQEKRTILFSSHLLGDVERVCDRIVILDRGVLRADCPVDVFKQSVRRIQMRPDENTQAWEERPGVLNIERLPDACVVTLVDTDGSTLERIRASASGPVEVIDLNLEDAFIAYTSGRRVRTLDLTGEMK